MIYSKISFEAAPFSYDLEFEDRITLDEDVLSISKKPMEQKREAYEVLDK